MELRVRETGQIITEREFRSLYPNTSFPKQLTIEILDARGVDPVLEGPQAITTPPYEISEDKVLKKSMESGLLSMF